MFWADTVININVLSAYERKTDFVHHSSDSASVLGPFHEYRMNYSDTLAKRHCPLQVYIKGLQLNLEGRSSIQLLGDGDGHAACIEPYVTDSSIVKLNQD